MGNDLLTDVYNKFLFVGQYGFVCIKSNISEIKLKMNRFHDKTFHWDFFECNINWLWPCSWGKYRQYINSENIKFQKEIVAILSPSYFKSGTHTENQKIL